MSETALLAEEHLASAVRESVEAVFSMMLSLQVSPGRPYQLTDPPPLTGVMALLGFTGNWVGTGMFYCHEKLACRVSSAMLMSEVTEVTNQVLDALGEVANMVLGNVKNHLEPIIGGIDISVPTVIYSLNFQMRTIVHHSWLVVPFSVGEDPFEIRICLTPKA